MMRERHCERLLTLAKGTAKKEGNVHLPHLVEDCEAEHHRVWSAARGEDGGQRAARVPRRPVRPAGYVATGAHGEGWKAAVLPGGAWELEARRWRRAGA